MKIRQGFVSNSSSSSFIAIGKQVNASEISESDIVDGKIWCEGRDLGDGTDIFQLKDSFALYIINNFTEEFIVYKIYKHAEDEIDITIKELNKLVADKDEKLTIFEMMQDYNSSNNTKSIYSRYVLEDGYGDMTTEQEKGYNKLKNTVLREKKLNRVLNDEKIRK